MLTLSKADAALKEYYLDAISAQLNQDVSPFFNEIEKTSQYVYGKYAKCTVYNGVMNRVVAMEEDDDLPNPEPNRYSEISLELKNICGSISISDKAMRASQDSSGAIVNLLDAEMEGLVSDAKANFARMIYGDGNGTVATIKSIDGTKVYLDNVKHWFYGVKMDVMNQNVMKASNFTVNKVNVAEGYVEFKESNSNLSTFAGFSLRLHAAYNMELTGLSALVDNPNLYGDDKVGNPYFTPYSASVTTLSADDIFDAITEIEERGGGKVKMILCSHSGRKKIAKLFADTQKVVTTNDVNLGYSSVYVNEIPVYADRYCPDNRIYFINPEDFVLCQLCDWEWLKDEHGNVLKPDPYKAAYNATIVKYAELLCKKPCGQGVIKL